MPRGLRLSFFADRADLTVLFEKFCKLGNYCYAPTYWDHDPVPPSLSNPADIPRYGFLGSGENSLQYMIVDASDAPNPRLIDLNTGGVRYAVDNATNPSSVRLIVGGDAGDRTLVASQIDTLGYTNRAREMQADFAKAVRASGKKISSYIVLPSALEKLQAGWRLAPEKGFARTMDLRP